jgi:hypothetical protein
MPTLAICPILNESGDATTSTEYNEWLERKVQASLAGLADGRNRTFSDAEWRAIRADRLAMRNRS